jgi:hypothetical protein
MSDAIGGENANEGHGGGDNKAAAHENIAVNPPPNPPNRESENKPCACTNGGKKGAFKAIVEIFVGVALVVVGALQYIVYTRQAHIMEIEQRPWISLESVEPASELTVEDIGSIHLTIKYILKNVGHSPAFDTVFYPVVVPVWFATLPGPTVFNAPADTKATDSMIRPNVFNTTGMPTEESMEVGNMQLCKSAFRKAALKEKLRNLSEQLHGQHIGFDIVSSGDVVFPEKTIEREFRITPKDYAVAAHAPAEAKSYSLSVTACVRYKESQSEEPHYTPSGYVLLGIYAANTKFDTALPINKEPIPLSGLRLRLGGQYAD